MECLECKSMGKHVEFTKACSLGTHLWKTHGMSSQEYYDKYLAKPGDGKCPVCGNPTLFRSLGKGYLEFCGKKCAANHIANDAKRNAHKVNAMKSTMRREYNVENPALLDSVKEKRKNTIKERYGVEFYSQHPDFKERYHDGCFNKFGEISYARTAEWLERVKKTNNEKYGADFWVKNRLNISIDYYTRELAKYGCRLLSHPDKVHLTYVCDKCGNTMDDTTFFVNCRLHLNSTPCSHCVPKRNFRSLSEMNVEKFINSLGVETTHYERGFLDEYGADIVCENEKVIVEYDGLHWHTDEFHDEKYHLQKTEYASEQGYHLVHIFSDEWERHEDIVKSRLCQLLHREIPGVSRKIYARDCSIVEVTAEAAREFNEKCHIQGSCSDKYRYGLIYENELVALMTFGLSRYADDEMELLRYCNDLYTRVIGGAGKLLNRFLQDRRLPHGVSLVTYADRRWSGDDAFYSKIGFTRVGVTEPNYYYVNVDVRESRLKYQKHKLVEMGFDPAKSEREIMKSLGMHRIYDCGNYKYRLDDAGHGASDEGNTSRKEEPELPVYTNAEGNAVDTSTSTPRKHKKITRMVPDSEVAAEYDELVRPFNCRVIHVDKRKNAKLLCNRCGRISKVFVPILRFRAENGVFPCGYCIPEHPERVPRDENGRMILDDNERPTTEVNGA